MTATGAAANHSNQKVMFNNFAPFADYIHKRNKKDTSR